MSGLKPNNFNTLSMRVDHYIGASGWTWKVVRTGTMSPSKKGHSG